MNFFTDLVKAVTGKLIPAKKLVHRKTGKVFTQTFYTNPGEEVKYKRPGHDKNWRTGTYLKTERGKVHIQAKRDNSGMAPIHKVSPDSVLTLKQYNHITIPKPPAPTITTQGDRVQARHNLSGEELRKRKKVVEQRIGMTELEIVKHPSFVGPAIKIVAELAQQNGISTAMNSKETPGLWHRAVDADYQDLLFHYSLGALKAWRRELSKPLDEQTKKNVKEFIAVLKNKKQSSYAHFVMEKEGKGAAIRHLTELREKWDAAPYQDISDMAEDPYARKVIERISSQPLQLKYTLAMHKETFRDDMVKVLHGMQPVEREMVKIKFGFHPYKTVVDEETKRERELNNTEVAAKLNELGYKDGKNKFTRNSVGEVFRKVIEGIRQSPMKDELGFHYDALLGRDVWKSIPDIFEEMLMKSEIEPTVPAKPVICVDFDGPIADYSKGYQGADVFGQMYVDPLTGMTASDAMKQLQRDGWHIMIFTCRPITPALTAYLATNQIPYDGINVVGDKSPKPMADIYLDDRGLRFYEWPQSLEAIHAIRENLGKSLLHLSIPLTRIPKEDHPEGVFKAGQIEYEVKHEGDDAVLVKGGSFDELFKAVKDDMLVKSAIDELTEFLEVGGE